MSAYAQVGENLDDLAALIEEKPFRAFFCFANESIIRSLQVFSCIFLVHTYMNLKLRKYPKSISSSWSMCAQLGKNLDSLEAV
jgi:hypothetical protein